MSMCSLPLCCWKRVFAITNVFSWQNSISLCPASFCTPRLNMPVTPGISWLPTFAFQSPIMKKTSFGGSSRRSYMSSSDQIRSAAQSCLTLCDPMNRSMPGLPVHHHHANWRPSSRWWHPAISSYVVPFSSCPQSLPASESFPKSLLPLI